VLVIDRDLKLLLSPASRYNHTRIFCFSAPSGMSTSTNHHPGCPTPRNNFLLEKKGAVLAVIISRVTTLRHRYSSPAISIGNDDHVSQTKYRRIIPSKSHTSLHHCRPLMFTSAFCYIAFPPYSSLFSIHLVLDANGEYPHASRNSFYACI